MSRHPPCAGKRTIRSRATSISVTPAAILRAEGRARSLVGKLKADLVAVLGVADAKVAGQYALQTLNRIADHNLDLAEKLWIRLDFPFKSEPIAVVDACSFGPWLLAARRLRSEAAVVEQLPCPSKPADVTTLAKSLKKQRIGEAEIKAAVLNRLKLQGRIDRRSTLASEFCLARTGVRTDLAAQSDRLIGVEIKSELDTLRRLPAQLAVYRAHFDCTVLVLASRHLAATASLDLAGVEIWESTADGSLRTLQTGCVGPAEEPRWADLMTQVERRRFLTGDGRAAFCAAFDHRFAGRSREFWRAVGRRQIKADDLTTLSRFRDVRLSQAASAEAREAKWADFAERARQVLEASEAA